MRLRRQIIDFRGPDLSDQPHQIAGIRRVRKMQEKLYLMIIGSDQMIDPRRVRNTVPPYKTVHLIPLLQQKLCQIGAVLSRNTRDQCYFLHKTFFSFLFS